MKQEEDSQLNSPARAARKTKKNAPVAQSQPDKT